MGVDTVSLENSFRIFPSRGIEMEQRIEVGVGFSEIKINNNNNVDGK